MIKCDICHFGNPKGFAYCGRCGNGLSDEGQDPTILDSTTIEGERKQVTIVFADISGFTALNDAAETQGDIERVLQIVNHCLHMLSEVVFEYDGYIDKYMGDSIMAIFGAPRTHEDDPERALRAALAMRERLIDFNENPPFPLAEPLDIHLGINTGTVIAGLIGSQRKRSYTVMGDAVNVAARLESVSERGEILVSQDTFNLTYRLFEFSEREPVFVKGKREALKLYELASAHSQRRSQRGIAGLRAPMIGRDREFDTLRGNVEALNENVGSINVVVGEAGLGKSRLTSELQQEIGRNHDHIKWFEGRALSFQQHFSYRLVAEILHQYLGLGADDSSDTIWNAWQSVGESLFNSRHMEVIPYLATLMGAKLPESVTQHMPLSDPMLLQQRMYAAVGEWVEAVVQHNPLTLIFEDLHWADENSVNVLEYLMSLSTHLPIMLVCITRPERGTRFWAVKQTAAKEYSAQYNELHLSPLTNTESRYLVDRLLSVEQLPNRLERLILGRSEGNPLFMEEVLRSLIEDETLVQKDNAWTTTRAITDINIPDTLMGVLTARIDRLDESVKRTLQTASVIGRVFDYDILETVLENTEDLEDQLDMLVATELIRKRSVGDGREYIFKHVLVQEAAYNGMLLKQRHRLHRKIADYLAQLYWMRGETYASQAAHHYQRGERWGRSLTYLIRAAKASQNAFDNDNAVSFYTRALEVSKRVSKPATETIIEIYEGRGNLLKRLGQIDDAKADFERIRALAEADDNAVLQMRALSELGKLHDDYEDYAHTARYFEDALQIARDVDDKPGIVDILNELADFHINMGQLDQAEAHLNQAVEITETLEDKHRLIDCQDGLAAVKLYRGDLVDSIRELEGLAQAWRNRGDYQGLMRTYVPLATAYRYQARYAESDGICHEGLEILERFGDLNWVPQLCFILGQNALTQGNFHDAEANIQQVIETAKKLGKGIWHAVGLAYRGYFQLLQGQQEAALTDIVQAVDMGQAIDAPLWTNRIMQIQGIAYRLTGQMNDALLVLREVYHNVKARAFVPDTVSALSALLEVQIAANQWDQIPMLLEEFIDLAVNRNMTSYHARALWVSARLAIKEARLDDAISTLQQAKALLPNTNDQLIFAAIEASLAEVWTHQGQPDQAKAALQAVESVLHSIAETITSSEARSSFLSMARQVMLSEVKGQISVQTPTGS